jgi:hypothetical protein
VRRRARLAEFFAKTSGAHFYKVLASAGPSVIATSIRRRLRILAQGDGGAGRQTHALRETAAFVRSILGSRSTLRAASKRRMIHERPGRRYHCVGRDSFDGRVGKLLVLGTLKMLFAQYGGEGIGNGISAGVTLFIAIAFLSLVGTIFGVYAVIYAFMQLNPQTAFRLGLAALSIGLGIFCWLEFPFHYLGLNALTAMILLPIVLGSTAVWMSFHPPEKIDA